MTPPGIDQSYPFHWCSGGGRLTQWGTPSRYQVQFLEAQTGTASAAQSIPRLPFPFSLEFSPDCSAVYISQFARETKRRRIYRYDLSTGKETDLLNDGAEWASWPQVSPDGRWLVLFGAVEGRKQNGALLLPTTGGAPRLLDLKGWWLGPIWTPDSKRLMYARQAALDNGPEGEFDLYWMSVEGGEPHPMGIRMPGALSPSLNADGRRIVFSAGETFNELWVLRNLPLK